MFLRVVALASTCTVATDPQLGNDRIAGTSMRAISCSAALVTALALGACGGGEGERRSGPGPSLGPAPALGSTIETGGSPTALAAGEGGVWVADNLRSRLLRIDPRTRTRERAGTAGEGPVAVATGAGAVWVASAGGTVSRYHSRTGAATGPPEPVPGASGVAVGEGAVWVTSQAEGTVTRLDPASGRRRGEPIKVGSQPTDIAVGGGSVWVANSKQYAATVSQIDPASGEVAAPIEVAKGQIFALTYGEGGVWVAVSDEVRGDEIDIIRIDPESAVPEGDFVRLGRPGLPVRLAAGAGAIWVAQAGSASGGAAVAANAGEVLQLDPERRSRVGAAASLPGAPTGISVGEGSVWIAIGGAGRVTSVDLTAGPG